MALKTYQVLLIVPLAEHPMPKKFRAGIFLPYTPGVAM